MRQNGGKLNQFPSHLPHIWQNGALERTFGARIFFTWGGFFLQWIGQDERRWWWRAYLQKFYVVRDCTRYILHALRRRRKNCDISSCLFSNFAFLKVHKHEIILNFFLPKSNPYMPFVNFWKKFCFFSFDFRQNFDVRTFPRWLSIRGTKFFLEISKKIFSSKSSLSSY